MVAVLGYSTPGLGQTTQKCHPLASGEYVAPNETVVATPNGNMVCSTQQQQSLPTPTSQTPVATTPATAPATPPTPTTTTPSEMPAPTNGHRRIVLEDNTPVQLVLSENLSSANATTGQTVAFEVSDEIVADGAIVVPRGSLAWGTVTEAQAKRRLGRAGKLDVNIDKVRLGDGEKVLLSATSHAKGGTHTGAMTAGIVATALVVWPAAPFFLLMHGKDITIPKGTKITAFINGDAVLDAAKFAPAMQ